MYAGVADTSIEPSGAERSEIERSGIKSGTERSGRTWIATGLIGLTVMLLVACSVPSVMPDGSVPQFAPVGLNGMAEETSPDGSFIWGADFFGHQLVRFDPDTGRIFERYGGLCDTDDVVVAPDGSLVVTCPGDGTVVRIQRNGTKSVLARVGKGVNPIALAPDGTSVYVGFGTADDDKLIRVPLDGSPTRVVASGLPILNGFGFGPDSILYAPTGGAEALLGSTGGLMSIDVTTGVANQIPLRFADDPARTGLTFAVGVDVAPDGTVYIVQGVDPRLWAVDPVTGEATLVGRSPLTAADNVAVLSDGRIALSGFVGNGIVIFSPDDSGGRDRHIRHVGG